MIGIAELNIIANSFIEVLLMLYHLFMQKEGYCVIIRGGIITTYTGVRIIYLLCYG